MKNKIVIFLVLITSYISTTLSSIAQIPSFKWGKGVHANNGYITGFGVSADAQGNSYVVGYSEPNCNPYFGGGDTLHGVISPFIVKYDSVGNVIWTRTVVGQPTNGNEIYWSDAVDKHGNIYVAGTTNSETIIAGADTLLAYGLSTTPDSFRRRIFLVKYSPSGDVIWTKKLQHKAGNPSQLEEYGFKITADANEGFIMTGSLYCADSSYYWLFGSDTIRNSTNFVAKFDSSGNALWAKPYGGLGLAKDSSGNIFVSGDYGTSAKYHVIGSDTLRGRRRILTDTTYCLSYIAKLTTAGAIIKAVNCGAIYSNNYDFTGFVRGLATDNRGNVYISSDWSDTLFIGTDTLIGSNGSTPATFFVARYNNNLNYNWSQADTNIGFGVVNSIVCDSKDNIYLCGGFNASSVFNPSSVVGGTIIKFDSSGVYQWFKSGSGYFAECLSSSINYNDEISMTGIVFDGFPCNFDGDTVVSSGLSPYPYGYFAAKLGTTAILGINNDSKNLKTTVIAYPNPVKSSMTLKIDDDLIGTPYSIKNIVGQMILSGKAASNFTNIQMEDFPPGMYLLSIGNISLKIIKN